MWSLFKKQKPPEKKENPEVRAFAEAYKARNPEKYKLKEKELLKNLYE